LHIDCRYFDEIEGVAKVNFSKFFIPDAPGNAVFPFVNADIQLDAFTHSLSFLNITLRSLPHYEIENGDAEIHSHFLIKNGVLLPGSYLFTDPSAIAFHTPDIRVRGHGKIDWRVTDARVSDMNINLHDLSGNQPEDSGNSGKIKKLDLHLALQGTHLVDAFHGLVANLNIKGLDWDLSESDGEILANTSGNAELIALAGDIPVATREYWEEKRTPVLLTLNSMTVKSEKFPELSMSGKIEAMALPLDLSSNLMTFPKVTTDLQVKVKNEKSTHANAELSNVSYELSPADEWKGHLSLVLDETAPLMKALKAQDQISWIVESYGEVEKLGADIDWQAGKNFSWYRINKVESSGIWKAYGSIINNNSFTTGAFEVSIGGLPIGIRMTPEKTEVTFLPSKNWYDQIFRNDEHESFYPLSEQ